MQECLLTLRGDRIGFKTTYAGDYCYHSVLKRGKQWNNYQPGHLVMESTVKPAKKTDVENLLAAIAAPEDVRDFYARALATTNEANSDSNSEGEDA